MQQYHLLPKTYRSNSVRENHSYPTTRATQKPLPRTPFCFDLPSSASYESLLEHEVPSASLCLDDAMSELWSRKFESSKRTTQALHVHKDSTSTLVDFGDWVSGLSTPRPQSVLLPAPVIGRRPPRASAVECRLSSTSSGEEDPQLSPLSKRSATPTQLNKLCIELEDLAKSSDKTASTPIIRSLVDARPVTPVPSLTHSLSFASTLGDTPSSTVSFNAIYSTPATQSMDRITHTTRPRLGHVRTDTGSRNVSPPVPSLIYKPSPFGPDLARPTTAESAVDPTYQPRRLAPIAPPTTQERSYVDWDDDDDTTRLARMKKSFTDLRNAGRVRANSKHKRHSAENVPAVPSEKVHGMRHSTEALPQLPVLFAEELRRDTPSRSSIRARSPTKLSKKPSIKVAKRSMSTKTKTKATVFARRNESLEVSQPPSPASKRKSKRFSFAPSGKSTSSKSGRADVGGLRNWMARIFGCAA